MGVFTGMWESVKQEYRDVKNDLAQARRRKEQRHTDPVPERPWMAGRKNVGGISKSNNGSAESVPKITIVKHNKRMSLDRVQSGRVFKAKSAPVKSAMPLEENEEYFAESEEPEVVHQSMLLQDHNVPIDNVGQHDIFKAESQNIGVISEMELDEDDEEDEDYDGEEEEILEEYDSQFGSELDEDDFSEEDEDYSSDLEGDVPKQLEQADRESTEANSVVESTILGNETVVTVESKDSKVDPVTPTADENVPVASENSLQAI